MTMPIIEVNRVSKKYRLGEFSARSLREELEVAWRRFTNGNGEKKAPVSEQEERAETDFWALKDVSFSVQPGDVVGIIGRNGAGKSTLLKILSRITEPTEGEVVMRGRVASLLEVGTGFHPELSGRDNIYLNGAILGMKKAEITRKFDEIVAFADVEKFVDTPVKRYSSGMYVRLAFAVAAYLEPEILIIDEVLAVGDAEFQKRCLGKMQEVSQEHGRTVLFVSHNMAAVGILCSCAAYLDKGRLITIEPTSAAIARYVATNRRNSYDGPDKPVNNKASWIRRAWVQRLEGGDATPTVTLTPGRPFEIVAELCVRTDEPVEFSASFYDQLRRPLWHFSNTMFREKMLPKADRLVVKLKYTLPPVSTPEIIIDLATGIPGGYPLHDLVVEAITCPITWATESSRSNFNQDFPLLLQPHLQVEVADCFSV